jgi:hypothetical protein
MGTDGSHENKGAKVGCVGGRLISDGPPQEIAHAIDRILGDVRDDVAQIKVIKFGGLCRASNHAVRAWFPYGEAIWMSAELVTLLMRSTTYPHHERVPHVVATVH